jgi:hypothetical protein
MMNMNNDDNDDMVVIIWFVKNPISYMIVL